MDITKLADYREKKEQENDFTVNIGRHSSTRINFSFGGYRESLTLNRQNFEKLVKYTRLIMGWDR